jgi:hypothetical protein
MRKLPNTGSLVPISLGEFAFERGVLRTQLGIIARRILHDFREWT